MLGENCLRGGQTCAYAYVYVDSVFDPNHVGVASLARKTCDHVFASVARFVLRVFTPVYIYI